MLSLALVSLIAWVLTILAPCVLPVLPVILAGSVGERGKWYPYIVTGSLALSIVAFTVLLKASTLLIDVSPDFWKYLSGVILLALGLVYIFPHTWTRISSRLFGSQANTSLDTAQSIESSTTRAIVTGAVLGPVFSTCSPTYTLLLATVFPVSLLAGIVYTLIYALGLSLVLLAIAVFGASLVRKLRVFADERGMFRKVLGLILALVGLLIVTGIDKRIETYVLTRFDISQVEQVILDKFIPREDPVTPEPTSAVTPPLSPVTPPVTSPTPPVSDISSAPAQTSPVTLPPAQTPPVVTVSEQTLPEPSTLPRQFLAPEITLTDWIGSDPLTMQSLRGKVVLIDFWTFGCINCQRTRPYLNKWHERYRDQGLVIIGVHAPEFAYEKVKSNLESAIQKEWITYPVALDNDFALWNAYNNQYWPAFYFVDKAWYVQYSHFGEWQYAENEAIIQQLLAE